MIKKFFGAIALISFIVCLASSFAWAVPGLINYQGKLTDVDGKDLNGNYQIGFYFYDAETDGNVLWSEQQTVMVTDGIYNVQLGSTGSSPFPVDIFRINQLYLEMVIHNPDTGSDETLSPRQRFASTAFAMMAGDVNTIVDTQTGTSSWTGGSGKLITNAAVGIDTTSPSEKLQIAGPGKLLVGTHSGDNFGGKLRVEIADGESEVQAIKTNVVRTTGYNYGVNGTAWGEGADRNVGLYGWASGATRNFGLWVASGDAIFRDNVGIGTMSPSYKLQVKGTAAGTSWTHLSDSRLEQDITTIDNALDKVSSLRGVIFNWRTEEFPDEGFEEGKKIGLVAQEVEKVLPEVVSTDYNGYKSVEYANIVAVLIEAMKTQQTQIAELKAKNEELGARIKILESKY